MLIVPETNELSIEVKVSPQDIDQVQPGLSTALRLSAFNQRSTPELYGYVSVIAADLVTDPRSGQQYYPVRLSFAAGERERLGTLRLVPGMPVEGLIRTGSRTVLSYLTKPVVDHAVRAFREE
ncbi:HlyD membrane-fusion protein of T1SS [Microvirga guangxiensis]|uniref:HlyD membrane-fusion protein of T1SS n=2 Tax=Microvirga guangxiensis TaxID=549386 RepID=A0A1G5JZ48_9HYPH|nr:HlyD membrane-fusion protein of T1SS [Microvirga guangxiensis]